MIAFKGNNYEPLYKFCLQNNEDCSLQFVYVVKDNKEKVLALMSQNGKTNFYDIGKLDEIIKAHKDEIKNIKEAKLYF